MPRRRPTSAGGVGCFLHESLLQRQRTDQAQRDAGMTGMPAGEREQLRAAIAALAAKLGR